MLIAGKGARVSGAPHEGAREVGRVLASPGGADQALLIALRRMPRRIAWRGLAKITILVSYLAAIWGCTVVDTGVQIASAGGRPSVARPIISLYRPPDPSLRSPAVCDNTVAWAGEVLHNYVHPDRLYVSDLSHFRPHLVAVSQPYTATATLLPNGDVLVEGGFGCQDGVVCASAELYAPSSGQWLATGSMSVPRFFHTATLLLTGKVLVAGGWGCGHGVCGISSAELYDPATGTWQPTGSMHDGRYLHTATLLQTGQVLVVGGEGCLPTHICRTAELYDAASGAWRMTGSLSVPREEQTPTLLRDGRVLVAGGYGCLPSAVCSSAELYDPKTGAWHPTGSMQESRAGHTATLLPDGEVLVVGGYGCSRHDCHHLASAEVYDPRTGQWRPSGSMRQPREYQTATLLPDGRVLVAGGSVRCLAGKGCVPAKTAEVYVPGGAKRGAAGAKQTDAALDGSDFRCDSTPWERLGPGSDPSGIHVIGFMHGELPRTNGWMPDGGIVKIVWVDAHDSPLRAGGVRGRNLSRGRHAPARVVFNGHTIFPLPGCWRLILGSGHTTRRVTMLTLGD